MANSILELMCNLLMLVSLGGLWLFMYYLISNQSDSFLYNRIDLRKDDIYGLSIISLAIGAFSVFTYKGIMTMLSIVPNSYGADGEYHHFRLAISVPATFFTVIFLSQEIGRLINERTTLRYSKFIMRSKLDILEKVIHANSKSAALKIIEMRYKTLLDYRFNLKTSILEMKEDERNKYANLDPLGSGFNYHDEEWEMSKSGLSNKEQKIIYEILLHFISDQIIKAEQCEGIVQISTQERE